MKTEKQIKHRVSELTKYILVHERMDDGTNGCTMLTEINKQQLFNMRFEKDILETILK